MSRQRSSTDERGAVALITGVVMSFVLIAIAAFAVDLGMQRSVRRDMQALADVVALDLARLLDGRTRNAIESGNEGRPPLSEALRASVANNDTTTLGDGSDCGSVGYATDAVASSAAGTSCVYAYLVELNPDGTYPTVSGGRPQNVGNSTTPDAVVVFANSTVDFGFGVATSGSATREALAGATSTACFRVGSYAAELDSTQSQLLDWILSATVGGELGLDAVSYQGLAAADVSLGALATELGLGSVEELASATVDFNGLLIAAADVLERDGDTANAELLRSISATFNLGTVNVAGLIELSSPDGAAEVVTLNALGLLAGSIIIANGNHAVEVPGLATSLGLTGTNLTTALTIIEGAQTACGRVDEATAETSQVDLAITGTLASVAGVLGLTVTAGDTLVDVDLASAQGTLRDVICGDGTDTNPDGVDVEVVSGLLGASLNQTLSVDGSIGLTGGLLDVLLDLLDLTDLITEITVSGDVSLTASAADPTSSRTAQIRIPPQAYEEPVSTGSGDLLVNGTSVMVDTDLTVQVSGLGIDADEEAALVAEVIDLVVDALVSDVLNPLISELNRAVLQPLTDLLGIELAGADVLAVKEPTCNDPRLFG